MKNTYFLRLKIAAFTAVFLFLGSAGAVSAANFTVTKTTDTNDGLCNADCSLREAVFAANTAGSNDSIDFAPILSGTPVTLSLGVEIAIVGNGTLAISGLGANLLTIDGGAGANRIFFINGATVAINNLTLSGGNGVGTNGGFGGAIFVFNGATQFDSVHVTGNFAATAGAGIYFTGGTHSVINSTFSNNTGANAGGLAVEAGSLSISNSTFSGNSVTSSGGALGFISSSTATLRNVTISGNSGSNGGGIFVSGATLNFGNTIVAGNAGGFPEILFAGGTITSAGNNLVGDSAGDSTNTGTPIAYQGSDIQNVSPQLMALGNYGGQTPTRALQFSSPARNNGSDGLASGAGLTFDQRGPGYLRFIGTVDVGAFEAQDQRFYVTKTSNSLDGFCNDDCSLREAIAAAPNGGVVDFSRALSGQTVVLGGSEIIINKVLTIDGFGSNLIDISGGGLSRIFAINSPVDVRITGVKLSGGNGVGIFSGFGGAVIVNGGNIILDAVDVTNNTVSGFGGGVFIGNSTNSRIAYSTISFNTSTSGCGGVGTSAATLYVVNSTFSDNTAATVGGGLCLDSNSSGTLRNVTIAGNSANFGGGISVFGSALNFGNTIVAANFAADDPEITFTSGTVTSAGNNLVGDSAGDAQNTNLPITYQGSDILNTPPVIGPLTIANGGTTPTRAIGPTSPAVDAGSNALAVDPPSGAPLLVDQRGFTRIFDGNLDTIPVVDIGAYEFASLQPTAAGVTVSGRVTDAKDNPIGRVQISMTDRQGNTRTALTNPFGYYSFEGVTVGETYVFEVFAKRYQFTPRVVVVLDALTELDFVAQQE